jgi:hypothetical protein
LGYALGRWADATFHKRFLTAPSFFRVAPRRRAAASPSPSTRRVDDSIESSFVRFGFLPVARRDHSSVHAD